jgi:hypothetical protein
MSRPLGRWTHCGDKKVILDVLEWKTQQKQHRIFLLENGIDPYTPYKKKEEDESENDYWKAFVFES